MRTLFLAAICALALVTREEAAVESIWVNDGNDLARLDFTDATHATFHFIGLLGSGATGPGGTTWSDSFGTTANVMNDIAWNSTGTVLYGVSTAKFDTNSADSYLYTINPATGAATLVTSAGNGIPGDGFNNGPGRDSETLTNALGIASNGQLLTAISTDNTIYSINPANNVATVLGNFAVPAFPSVRYSSGDFVTFNGSTYLLANSVVYSSGFSTLNYLVNVNLSNPGNSTAVQLPGSFDSGSGLAALSFGLYAVDENSKTISLVDPSTGNLTAVTISGSTSALAFFYGAASTVPVPEPATWAAGLLLLLALAGRLMPALFLTCRLRPRSFRR